MKQRQSVKHRLVQKGRTASSGKTTITTTTRSRSAFARPAAKTTGGEQIRPGSRR